MKKFISILSIIIILVESLVILVGCGNEKSNDTETNIKQEKIQKANDIFGDDYCKGGHEFEIAGDAITKWSCKVCGYKDEHSNTAVPSLCDECAEVTERCNRCGKLFKD